MSAEFDAILLNLSLPDGDTLLATFGKIQAAAVSRPILILADSGDENLAHTLLRHGAQDVLVKSQIECDALGPGAALCRRAPAPGERARSRLFLR
jgi:DNA-binding NarL/FixJ family response regulator